MTQTTEPITIAERLPQNPAAEEAVLGAILIDSEVIGGLSFLLPEDFYIERNKWVYQATQDLRREGMEVDYLTVATLLEKRGQLNQIGGAARLMSLINRTPSSLNADSYAREVKDEASRRRVLSIATDLARAAMDRDSNLPATVSAGLDRLSRSVYSSSGAVHISQVLEQVKQEVEEAMAHPTPDGVYGIHTGLDDWNRITGGLMKGEVVKLVGDPGVGKSLLAMQMLCGAAEHGHPGVLYELEMGGKQVVRRSLSAYTTLLNAAEHNRHLATRAMRTGSITPEQHDAFIKALEHMAHLPIYVSDQTQLTTADLRVDLIRLIENFAVEVVVIDYEGLLQDEARDRNEHSMLVSDRVHAIIKDLDLAGISIGDMTKEGVQGKVTGQGAMAGTARELHNADQIVRLSPKAKDSPVILAEWLKNREGGSGNHFDLLKLPGFPVFGSIQKARVP
jgi:replicative DNA helicase